MANSRLSAFVRSGVASALPIYASPFAKGAPAGGDDDDDDGDDDDDDGDDDDDDDPDVDKSEDELRAELKSVRESLSKANGQSAKRRKALRAKEAELVAERTKRAGKKPAADGDDAPDVDEIRESAKREGESAGVLRAKKAEAKAELIAAGIPRESVPTALRMLDFDELDLDDDGLDGIDDAIADLRRTLPALFAKKRQRRESIVGDADRDGKDRRPKPKTASELAAARLLARG